MDQDKFYIWTNELTFSKPRLVKGMGECQIQDNLFYARKEQGLSSEEAEALCLEDSLEEVAHDVNWAPLGNF